MPPRFDLDKLNPLLKDFYTVTRIRVTVFDGAFQEVAAYPERIAPFCQMIRTDPSAARACAEHDRRACEIARHGRSPHIYRCHAGLTESIVPLYKGNIVIGYLLFGHVFCYPSREEGLRKIEEFCAPYRIDPARLRSAAMEMPLISQGFISAAAQLLKTVASYLCQEQAVILPPKELSVQIDEYISEHFTEHICAEGICEWFQIGRTQLYEIARQNYGTGIAAHIRRLRIEKAKQLLREHPELRISEIASECGFNDYNYFITVFKRIVGVPPKQYQQI